MIFNVLMIVCTGCDVWWFVWLISRFVFDLLPPSSGNASYGNKDLAFQQRHCEIPRMLQSEIFDIINFPRAQNLSLMSRGIFYVK